MRKCIVALALSLALPLLVGCGAPAKGPYVAPGQKGCDDGGSGGVLIDGVCL